MCNAELLAELFESLRRHVDSALFVFGECTACDDTLTAADLVDYAGDPAMLATSSACEEILEQRHVFQIYSLALLEH